MDKMKITRFLSQASLNLRSIADIAGWESVALRWYPIEISAFLFSRVIAVIFSLQYMKHTFGIVDIVRVIVI